MNDAIVFDVVGSWKAQRSSSPITDPCPSSNFDFQVIDTKTSRRDWGPAFAAFTTSFCINIDAPRAFYFWITPPA